MRIEKKKKIKFIEIKNFGFGESIEVRDRQQLHLLA